MVPQRSMGCTSIIRSCHYHCYECFTDATLMSKSRSGANDFERELITISPSDVFESLNLKSESSPKSQVSHESLRLKSESQCLSPGPSAQVWVTGSTQNKVIYPVRGSVVSRWIYSINCLLFLFLSFYATKCLHRLLVMLPGPRSVAKLCWTLQIEIPWIEPTLFLIQHVR